MAVDKNGCMDPEALGIPFYCHLTRHGRKHVLQAIDLSNNKPGMENDEESCVHTHTEREKGRGERRERIENRKGVVCCIVNLFY